MANKYHARRWNGYDSKHEAARAEELRLRERAGEIKDLRTQVPFELIPAQWEEIPRYGKRGQPLKPKRRCVERPCTYIADFVYTDSDGNEIVEDAKSPATRTAEYRIKRKLMLFVHHIHIREV